MLGFGISIKRSPRALKQLGALILSANSIVENSGAGTIVGTISGTTPGSVLALGNDAAGRFAVTGGGQMVAGLVSTDFESATSHQIAVDETLSGASNSPKRTLFTITVSDVLVPSFTAPPVISGTAMVGQVLTASDGTIVGGTASARQWKRSGAVIGGQTSANYTAVTADIGATLTIDVTATNVEGSATATSSGFGPVQAASNASTLTKDGVVLTMSTSRQVGQYTNGDPWAVIGGLASAITPASADIAVDTWLFAPETLSYQTTANTLTKSGAAPPNNSKIRFAVPPAGLAANVTYFVVNSTFGAANTTWQMSATQGGAALPISANGSTNMEVFGIRARTSHGAMINHGNRSFVGGLTSANGFGSNQGFDTLDTADGTTQSTLNHYTAGFNIDPAKSGPITLVESTIIKTVGRVAPVRLDAACINQMVPFTFVTTPPAANAFRPGIAGASKLSLFNATEIDLSVLPNLAIPGAIPTIASLLANLGELHQVGMTDNTQCYNISGTATHPHYGRDIGYYVGEALMMLCLNIPAADKLAIAKHIIQHSIDAISRIQEGGYFRGVGGGNSWHKAMIVFAAKLMQNSPNVALLNSHADFAQVATFCEDTQPFIVDAAMVATARYTADARPRTAYSHFMLRAPDWNESGGDGQLSRAGSNKNTFYRDIISNSTMGQALACYLLAGGKTAWNRAATFAYYDRWWDWTKTDTWPANGPTAFTKLMWQAYRQYDAVTVPTRTFLEARDSFVWATFDQLLTVDFVPATAAFTVLVNGIVRTVTAVTVYGYSLAVTLASSLVQGDLVTFTYAQPGSNQARTVGGVFAASITALAATNRTGELPPAPTSIAKVDNNGGTVYSKVPTIVSGDTGIQRVLIAMKFDPQVLTANANILADAAASSLRLYYPTTTRFRFQLGSSAIAHFENTTVTTVVGDQRIFFLVDFTKASVAAGGMIAFKDDVSIPAGGSTAFTTASSLSMASIFNGGLGIFAEADGGGVKLDGAYEWLWMDWGNGSYALPDITQKAVRDQFTSANFVGTNGQVSGIVPQLFFAGSLAEHNDLAGMINRGRSAATPPISAIGGVYS